MRYRPLENGLYEDPETGAVGKIKPGRGGGWYLDTSVDGGKKGEKKAKKEKPKTEENKNNKIENEPKVQPRSQMEEYSARPNQDKLIDMVDEGLISYEDATLMAFKYNSFDDIKSAMDTLGYDTDDIHSIDDIYDDDIDVIGEELLAEMTDDDIGDMMRANGIEDENVEDTKEEIYKKLYDMNKVQAIDYVDKLYGENKIDTDTYDELKDFVGVNEYLTGDEVLNAKENYAQNDDYKIVKDYYNKLSKEEALEDIETRLEREKNNLYDKNLKDKYHNWNELAKQYAKEELGVDDENVEDKKSKPYSYLDDDDIDRDFPELSKKVTDKFDASLQQAANELGYDVNTNDGKEFMEISNRAKEIRENETRANLYRKQVLGNANEATDAANELAQRETENQFEVGDLKRKALEVLPKEDIDSHASDLYIKKTPESEALLNNMKDKDSGLLTTFKDRQTGETWYEIPFANAQDDFNDKFGKTYKQEQKANDRFNNMNLSEEKSQREAKMKDSYNAWQKHYDKSDWNNEEWRTENDRLYKEMDQNRSDYNKFFKDYVNKVDDSQLSWQDRVGKLQLERENELSKLDRSRESDKYYDTFAEYEKKFAKVRSNEPNDLYEPVDSYYSYKDKRDRLTNTKYDDAGNLLDWNSGAKWTGKEYTNDEFFEHLEDANWHTERRLLEMAGLTNKEMEYIKNNTSLMDGSVGPELTGRENVQKMIDKAKSVSKNINTKTWQEKQNEKIMNAVKGAFPEITKEQQTEFEKFLKTIHAKSIK